MTIAILIWQAIIFITIAASGRARGWVVAGWVVWTVIQVATLPLSVIQFATIAIAYFLFKGSKPQAAIAPPKLDPDEERRRVEMERQRQEDLAQYARAKSERRQKGLGGMALWGMLVAGSILWQKANGFNDFAMIVFFVCVPLLLYSFIKVLD